MIDAITAPEKSAESVPCPSKAKNRYNSPLQRDSDTDALPLPRLRFKPGLAAHPSIDSRKKTMSEAGAIEVIVNQQITLAMKAHDAVRTTTLRLIKNALKNKAIEKRAAPTQAESEQVLATMIKQRRDSIEQFTNGNRPELAAKEAAEIAVIEEFLPKALDEAGLAALVAEAVAEVTAAAAKAPTQKEMGVVMKAVQGKLQAAGARAEGRLVSELVKKALAG
jgi:hypothetical protein